MNLMVITNQKPIINTNKTKRKDSKHNTKDTHQVRRKEQKKEQNTTQTTKNN